MHIKYDITIDYKYVIFINNNILPLTIILTLIITDRYSSRYWYTIFGKASGACFLGVYYCDSERRIREPRSSKTRSPPQGELANKPVSYTVLCVRVSI